MVLRIRVNRKHVDLAHVFVDPEERRGESNDLPGYLGDPDLCLLISQDLLDVPLLPTPPVVAVQELEDLVPRPRRLATIRTP